MTQIATYSMIYAGGTIDLCANHAETHKGLGECQHGTRPGTCEDCQEEEIQRRRGAAIRARRESAGMTQAQLAAKLGVARETVARWESGAGRPTKRARIALDAVLAGEPIPRRPGTD
jgi:DNA-binding transcriptional regulator YiaG